jgi:hypothetical protein
MKRGSFNENVGVASIEEQKNFEGKNSTLVQKYNLLH